MYFIPFLVVLLRLHPAFYFFHHGKWRSDLLLHNSQRMCLLCTLVYIPTQTGPFPSGPVLRRRPSCCAQDPYHHRYHILYLLYSGTKIQFSMFCRNVFFCCCFLLFLCNCHLSLFILIFFPGMLIGLV